MENVSKQWIISLSCTAIAILFHGLGHLITARLCHSPLMRLRLTATGMRLLTKEQTFPSYDCETVIALGGPCGNLLGNASLLLITAMLPTPWTAKRFFFTLTAEVIPISLYLAVWNLLPIRGFDGARILQGILCRRYRHFPSASPATAERIIDMTGAIVLLILWFFSVYLLLRTGTALSLYMFSLQLFFSLFLNNNSRNQERFS